MDPATIIGLTGAIFGIIDVTTRTIKALRVLSQERRTTDVKALTFVSQLLAFKTSLDKIQEWISSDLANQPQSYQLILDLDDSLGCCWIVIEALDARIASSPKDGDASTSASNDASARVHEAFVRGVASRKALSSTELNDFQSCIQQQTASLTLLLTACNSISIAEQRAFLEQSSTRGVFDRAKDDTSSMVVLHDAASIFTRTTSSSLTSTATSMVFSFDSKLLSSPVYRKAIRNLFKRAGRTKPALPDHVQAHPSGLAETTSLIDLHQSYNQANSASKEFSSASLNHRSRVLITHDLDAQSIQMVEALVQSLVQSLAVTALQKTSGSRDRAVISDTQEAPIDIEYDVYELAHFMERASSSAMRDEDFDLTIHLCDRSSVSWLEKGQFKALLWHLQSFMLASYLTAAEPLFAFLTPNGCRAPSSSECKRLFSEAYGDISGFEFVHCNPSQVSELRRRIFFALSGIHSTKLLWEAQRASLLEERFADARAFRSQLGEAN